MPIAASDILFKLSTIAGSAGNSNAGTPGASLGKYISTTQVDSGDLHDLFTAVSGAENAANQVDYACLFVHNAHASLTLTDAKVYVSAEVSGGTAIAIAVDSVAASAIGSASAQADQIANDTTAPDGIDQAFSTPTTTGAALALGSIPAGSCKAIWVRRTASNSSPQASDGATITVFGDTL
jgi:hypothetical protein